MFVRYLESLSMGPGKGVRAKGIRQLKQLKRVLGKEKRSFQCFVSNQKMVFKEREWKFAIDDYGSNYVSTLDASPNVLLDMLNLKTKSLLPIFTEFSDTKVADGSGSAVEPRWLSFVGPSAFRPRKNLYNALQRTPTVLG